MSCSSTIGSHFTKPSDHLSTRTLRYTSFFRFASSSIRKKYLASHLGVLPKPTTFSSLPPSPFLMRKCRVPELIPFQIPFSFYTSLPLGTRGLPSLFYVYQAMKEKSVFSFPMIYIGVFARTDQTAAMSMELSQEAKLLEKEVEEEETHEEQVNRTKVKVLIALDESEGSLHALNWALDHLFGNADSRDSRSLTILHVIQPFPQYFYPGGPGVYVTPMVIDSVIQSQERNSVALLNRASMMCSEKHVIAEAVKKEGEPKETICQVVDLIHADLVVVGSRGLGTIKRAVLGSVSDYVAHHAKCPVLIVKPPK